MPGGYACDEGEGDIRQGAIMDRGGAIYMLGRNGGMMNDGRGQSAAAHVINVYPDFRPLRILELGCGVGVSAVAMARHFPDAEFHAVDVGGAMLRYAHARAESLGTPIHFSQQNAEGTTFEDGSFDLVFTAALYHETSAAALPKIIAEMHRLLKPGGVALNLEVPYRYDKMSIWEKVIGEFETHYNNEPFWRGAIVADYAGLMREAGFQDLQIGYQPAATDGRRDAQGFSDTPSTTGFSWFVASARKG
jgi:ubiquinone/menaquinone biosynthesis C-methylase UbiE